MILGDRELAPTTLKSLRCKPPLSPNYTFPNREPNESGESKQSLGGSG